MFQQKIDTIFHILKNNLPNNTWDGKECIKEMRENKYKHWKQMEWPGFYFQFKCETLLSQNQLMSIPGPKFNNVEFDGFSNIPWDFKAHSIDPNKTDNEKIPTNGYDETIMAIEKYGNIGFIIITGLTQYDDASQSFKRWHDEYKGGISNYEMKRVKRSAQSRRRKISFTPQELIFVFLNKKNINSCGKFQEDFRNSNGSARNPKVLLKLKKNKDLIVFRYDFQTGEKSFPQHFRFIDLFAGIGGFHQAMHNLGGECVFASEIDKYAIETYKVNYGIDAGINIRDVHEEDIPEHEVLCAGFPCQAFSKAGYQKGFEDETRGTLFFEIVRILKYHRTPYIILENVRNLTSHDHGNTWRVIKSALHELGYIITEEPIIISPHQLGVPQLRERVVILGVHKSLGIKNLNIKLPDKSKDDINFLTSGILEKTEVNKKYYISSHEEKVLTCWNEFIKGIQEKVIGFPIWSDEFGQTYNYRDLGYADWKVKFIQKNRQLYENNKEFIDSWLRKWNNLEDFTMTEKKFEWQCGKDCSSVWEALIQFRPSGVRVKRPSVFPALVAMVQIPIIGSVKRRLTPREAARLQSFPDNFICNPNDRQAYKQFGNAVNVQVIQYMAEQLFKQKDELEETQKDALDL